MYYNLISLILTNRLIQQCASVGKNYRNGFQNHFNFFHLECFRNDEIQEVLFHHFNLFEIGQRNMNQIHLYLLHHLFKTRTETIPEIVVLF